LRARSLGMDSARRAETSSRAEPRLDTRDVMAGVAARLERRRGETPPECPSPWPEIGSPARCLRWPWAAAVDGTKDGDRAREW
jgi:hypothetical protein